VVVLAWIGIGWLFTILWTAIGTRWSVGHVLPDAAVITLVFVAQRREPIAVALIAVGLGYLVGRQALAPVGLHETAAMITAFGVYFFAGNIAGHGGRFFAVTSGGAVMGYHLTLYILAAAGGQAGFASGWAASLVPSGIATGLVAFASYPVLLVVEGRLSTEAREELSWR
jgi:hypothetical protein